MKPAAEDEGALCLCGHMREEHQNGMGNCQADGGECACLRFESAALRDGVLGRAGKP